MAHCSTIFHCMLKLMPRHRTNLRPICTPGKKRAWGNSQALVFLWRAMGDSNARPLVPETNALSTELIARKLNIIKPKTPVKADCG